MTHEELSALYELYAFGVLEGEEKVELEEHLARHCPECELGVRQAFAFSATLAVLPDPMEPPRHLRKRILASVGAEPVTNRWWIGALALVSACLLIALVLTGLERTRHTEELAQLQGRLRQNGAELTRLQAALQILNQPETRQVVFGTGAPQPPKGRIFVNPQSGVLLIASNLPAPPAGKAYEMWLVPKTGAPIPAGLFQSDAQGNALYLRSEAVNIASTKAVAVTLEPQAGSTTPTMPLVLAAGLE